MLTVSPILRFRPFFNSNFVEFGSLSAGRGSPNLTLKATHKAKKKKKTQKRSCHRYVAICIWPPKKRSNCCAFITFFDFFELKTETCRMAFILISVFFFLFVTSFFTSLMGFNTSLVFIWALASNSNCESTSRVKKRENLIKDYQIVSEIILFCRSDSVYSSNFRSFRCDCHTCHHPFSRLPIWTPPQVIAHPTPSWQTMANKLIAA